MADQKTIGILAILAAAVMWAIEPVLANRAAVNSDFLQTSAVRAIVVMLVASLYALLTNSGSLKVQRKELPVLVYVALAGTVFADLMYFYALMTLKVPVLNAVLIGHMQPIFVVLFGYVFLKGDRLTRFDYLGILVVMVSGLLVSTQTVENLRELRFGTLGDLVVLAATVAWATTGIAARRYLTHLNAGVITFYRYLFASIVFVSWLLTKDMLGISNVYQALVGVVVGVGTVLYYESLKRLKAALVSTLELAAPFFAAIFGFLFLREEATPMQIAGIFLIVVGVHLLSRKDTGEEKTGERPVEAAGSK